ncbi:hypothetical protein EC973_001814 [Apophysomyces ossiformis]|uniref:Cytochrome P450 n=1 Tax=Apophysomyces ossiformis TaxID=679940 RepID=A0A8H7BJ35_9FUNG|nr:hypothetical protein EC973_001814 [Apophysomyces ossiformis]
MGSAFSSLIAIGLSIVLSKLASGLLWKDKREDGTPKAPWPPSPSTPFYWNGFDVFQDQVYKAFTSWAEELGPFFSVKLGQKRVLVLNSASLVRQAYVEQEQRNSSRTLADNVESIMTDKGKTVFSAPFDMYWNRLRRAIHLVIGGPNVDRFEHLFSSQSEKLRQGILLAAKDGEDGDHRKKGNAVRLDPEHLRQVVDMIALDTSLAMVVGRHADPAVMLAVAQKVKETEALQSSRWIRSSQCLPIVRSLDSLYAVFSRNKAVIDLRNSFLETFVSWFPETAGVGSIGASLLQVHPSKYDPEPVQLAKDEILVNLVHLTLHSYKYVAASLFTVIQRLATSAEWQDRLYEEVSKAEDTSSWPTVEAFIKECLRLDPPCKLISHTSRVDHELVHEDVSYRVDLDSELIANLDAIHTDETFYRHPHTFDPERFLKSEKKTVSLLDSEEVLRANEKTNKGKVFVGDHLAFGAGRRVCQGRKASERLLAVAVAHLVQSYKLQGGHTETKIQHASGIWSWTGYTETKGSDIEFSSRA